MNRSAPVVLWLCCSLCLWPCKTASVNAQLSRLKFPQLVFKPPKPETVKLSNGIEVFLLEDHEVPIVDGYALIRTGSIYDPPDKVGLAEITGDLLRTGGTHSYTPEELNETGEFVAAALESDIDEETGSASLSVLSKDLDPALRLMAEGIEKPRFDGRQPQLFKKQLKDTLRRRNDDPTEVASREFAAALYGREHPLARFPKEAEIESITEADARSFYGRFYVPQNILLGFAGDFKKDL